MSTPKTTASLQRIHDAHVEHHRGNVARCGSRPKVQSGTEIHPAMHHVTDGQFTAGISKTELARRQDASGAAPSDPTYNPKTFPPLRAAAPGMRSRTQNFETGPADVGHHARRNWNSEAAHELGRRIIAEAVISGGK